MEGSEYFLDHFFPSASNGLSQIQENWCSTSYTWLQSPPISAGCFSIPVMPRCSMYGSFTYMKGEKWPHSRGHVAKYYLHGAPGNGHNGFFPSTFVPQNRDK